jgi:uncharacterized protein YybS (DUF2232 family)
MFQGIAQFAMQGRWQAALMTALLSIAAVILPPVNYLASGVISLTTLRMGPREGASVVTATLIVFALLAGFLLGQVWVVAVILLTSWLPVFLATLTLGYTRSLAAGVLSATAVGLVVVMMQHLFLSNPAEWWFGKVAPVLQQMHQQGSLDISLEQLEKIANQLAVWMPGMMAAGISLNALLGLFIGRSWQAKLFNPGGFSLEFRQLRLGKVAVIVAVIPIVVTAMSIADGLSVIANCLFVVLLALTIQGLAILHAIIHDKQKSKIWLVITYILLVILLPQMMMILSTLAVLDQWFNFRKLSK